jgi:hypothetical protein
MPVIQYIEFDQAENLTDRMHATAMRESLRYGAHRHVDVRLKKHFQDCPETQPGGAYGYEQRNVKYKKSAVRKYGPEAAQPNVRSKKLRNSIGNDTRARKGITATQNRSRIVLKAYFPLTAQRRSELEAISPQECREISDDVRGFYVDFVQKNRRLRRRKRI